MTILEQYIDKAEAVEASVSGKYHHGESLLEHTVDVALIVAALAQAYQLGELDTSLLVSAALLHDLGKLECVSLEPVRGWVPVQDGKYYIKTPDYSQHARVSVEIIMRNRFKYSRAVAKIVETHMGPWDRSAPRLRTFKQHLLYNADVIASRSFIGVRYG